MAYTKLAKLTDAMHDLDKAIEINEDYVKAYLKRAEILMQQEKYEEAVRDYEKVRQIEPCKFKSFLYSVYRNTWYKAENSRREIRVKEIKEERLLQDIGG